ncbi:uncharacterized protein MYCGRDRAFT_71676 [Zymoseptoria tritici IPO323]|uniref:Epoxide hydrolase N-terminal domain-containing protein n=1 Tax=Zymoseptoria tritici (strain CBS 115943 / IPO323) TaxID=336722 RepID=F9XAH2_ZYMTI|nr:uncharacterized protein MYCGRDRAFT_71676 [Zymoseptoria tritici IPO323]EGP86991.1 hypothetical protein MYCGRDRAFT_71676 [Zymoseptoria tritici IPO323]
MAPFSGVLEVKPFKAAVSDSALEDFKQLLRLSKVGPATLENSSQADSAYGLSRDWTEKAKDYWLNKYDWRKTEERINSFENYKATITGEDGENLDIHFLALRSSKPDAVPVVLLHGWPGSVLEFLGMLDLARNKYKSEDLPYTFIVPSLPGYAYSSGPSMKSESTCETMAYFVDKLMVGLGFGSGYIAQGGDIGSFVSRILGAQYESCKAVHVNFNIMQPPEGEASKDITAMEMKGLERAGQFNEQGSSYAMEHGQRPATIGLVLSTSPLALLIWIGEKYLEWVDDHLSLDHILDSVSLYWFTDSFPRAIYPYRQFFGPKPKAITKAYYIGKPMGYSWFPREIAPMPLGWVRTTGNLVWHKSHEKGGHFAALERPQDLLDDVEEFVKAVWK